MHLNMTQKPISVKGEVPMIHGGDTMDINEKIKKLICVMLVLLYFPKLNCNYSEYPPIIHATLKESGVFFRFVKMMKRIL